MPQIITLLILFFQTCIGLFSAGIGVENWRLTGYFDTQSLFLLILSLGSWFVFLRFCGIPLENRSLKHIGEHATLLGIIVWIFHSPWAGNWEIYALIFVMTSLIVTIICEILEPIVGKSFLSRWGSMNSLWHIGEFLAGTNTLTIPLIFVLLHQPLSWIWIFYGIYWLFLWKWEHRIS